MSNEQQHHATNRHSSTDGTSSLDDTSSIKKNRPRGRREDRPARQHAETYSLQAKPASTGAKPRIERGKAGNKAAPSSSENRSAAYLQSFAKVPQAACDYVDRLLEGYHSNTVYVFKHILNSGRLHPEAKGWVPVPSRLIQRKKPKADLDQLIEDELIQRIEHDRIAGLCREYRVAEAVRRDYDRITWENRDGPKVNLFTSRPTQRTRRSKLTDDNNNSHPPLVKKALRVITHGYFNRRAVERHLQELRERMLKAEGDAFLAKKEEGEDSEAFKKAQKAYDKAMARFSNDLRCYEALTGQAEDETAEGIVQYRTAYRPQMSGRITQIGGGAQSASREMKEAIYEGVEDVRNYDIRSSQALILIDFLREAGLDASWIERYVDTEDAKRIYAAKAGLSVDAWKACLYALLMGATLPKSIETSKGDIRKEIVKDVGEEQLVETYRRFRRLVAPLYATLQAWHDYLVGSWYDENSHWGHRGMRYVRNDVDMSFTIDDVKRPDKQRAKLAAFLLQGREAAFIHALTFRASKHGVEVISNEHDGLVTLGEIPEEVVECVRQSRSMPYVELVEKSFT